RTRTPSEPACRSGASSREPPTARRERPGVESLLDQLGQVLYDDVRAVTLQCCGMVDSIDSHDEAEVTRAPRLDPRERLLAHDRLRRLDTDSFRPGEERVRRGLALQMLAVRDDAVDDLLEQVDDPCVLEHVSAVRAR